MRTVKNLRHKNRSYLVIFIFGFVFGGCNGSSTNMDKASIVKMSDNSALLNIDSSFYSFAQNIPILDSNFKLTSKEGFNHLDISSKFIPEGAGLIGRLEPIDNYEFIIYSYPADVRLPILEVYNFKGEKVNEAVLFNYGYCSDGNPEASHEVELSTDHSTIYRSTFCMFAFSAFGYDSIVVRDLISH